VGPIGFTIQTPVDSVIRGVTIADHVQVLDFLDYPGPAALDLELERVIFREGPATDLATDTSSAQTELLCGVVTSTTGTFVVSHVLGGDPLFVDAADGDYHVFPSSPAIGLCPELSTERDIDGEQTLSFPAHAGGDDIPLVFLDGFESGDTTTWAITIGD